MAAAADIRAHATPIISFSVEMIKADQAVKAFLLERMYRHHHVNRMSSKARRIVKALFVLFMAEPELLSPEWSARSRGRDEAGRARVVADYIAGMTDRYALDAHSQLFEPAARS